MTPARIAELLEEALAQASAQANALLPEDDVAGRYAYELGFLREAVKGIARDLRRAP